MDAHRRFLGCGTPVDKDRLHVTLWVSPVFESFPQDLAERMFIVGSKTRGERFVETLNQLSRGQGCVVLRPERSSRAARQFARQLRNEMRLLGDESPRKQFNFHVTLLYTLAGSVALSSQRIEPIEWFAENFVLIHSVIGRHQHNELGRWPLDLPKQREFLFDYPLIYDVKSASKEPLL